MQDVTKGVSLQAEDLTYITDVLNKFSSELDYILQTFRISIQILQILQQVSATAQQLSSMTDKMMNDVKKVKL